MGAAVAQYAAIRLKVEGASNISVTTFGCPRLFSPDAASWVKDNGPPTKRIICALDPVPKFKMLGELYLIHEPEKSDQTINFYASVGRNLDAIGRNSSIRSTSTFNLARADSMPITRPKTALSKLIPGAASLPVMPSPRSPDGKEPVKSSPRLQDWKPGPVKPLRMGVSEGRSSPRKLQLSASERNLSGFLRQPPAGSSSSGPPPRRPAYREDSRPPLRRDVT